MTTTWAVTMELLEGYELPIWYRAEHANPESAHAEAEKLAQWAGVPVGNIRIAAKLSSRLSRHGYGGPYEGGSPYGKA